MREIVTKEVGVVAVFLVLLQWGCGGRDVTAPTSPSISPSLPSLTGTWRGGDSNMRLVWQLTQDGGSISGSSQIVGRDGWTAAGGRVVGTVAGSTFRFDETHAVGTVSDAGCSTEFQGILNVNHFTEPPRVPPVTYPAHPPLVSPSQARGSMSGPVTGRDCFGPLDTTIVLFRD